MASIISPDLSVVLKIDIRCHRSGILYHEPISRKGVGHIDIRHYHELNTLQRIALRMGMDSNFQKQLIGQQLLFLVIDYCGTRDGISWLDL